MPQPAKALDPTATIIGHLESALARSINSMTGKEFTVLSERRSDLPPMEAAFIWQQTLSIHSEPALWIVAPKELWTLAGTLTLEAVGIDSATDEDCRSTWQEIVGQTTGAFATALTTDVQNEVTAAGGEELQSEPPELPWTVFSVRAEDGQAWFLKIAWSKAVASLYEAPAPQSKVAATRDSTFSKTFDLLLDVALPVSVSFGKTHLQIREVLKLNTGSIVELNRFVVEPVDVIVNDCVIARGEVVVVDGNYGVRITQLASREDRLRTGMADQGMRVAGGAR
jgi:flagellar motor switch protein FliN/FliY